MTFWYFYSFHLLMKNLGSKASMEISFGSVQLDYVIIGVMASGFLVTFIAIAYLFRRKKQWVRNIRTSSFVDRLSYHWEWVWFELSEKKKKMCFYVLLIGWLKLKDKCGKWKTMSNRCVNIRLLNWLLV